MESRNIQFVLLGLLLILSLCQASQVELFDRTSPHNWCEFKDLLCRERNHCQELTCNGACFPFGVGGSYYKCQPINFMGMPALNMTTVANKNCQGTMVPAPCNYCATMGGYSMGAWCDQAPPSGGTTTSPPPPPPPPPAGAATLCRHTQDKCGDSSAECLAYTCDNQCRMDNGQYYTCSITSGSAKITYWFDKDCKSMAPQWKYSCDSCESNNNLQGFYRFNCPTGPSWPSNQFDQCTYSDNKCYIQFGCNTVNCDGTCKTNSQTMENYKCTFNSTSGAVSKTLYFDPGCSMTSGTVSQSPSCGSCVLSNDGFSYTKYNCKVGSSNPTSSTSTSTSTSTKSSSTSSSSSSTTKSSSSTSSSSSTMGSSSTTMGSSSSTSGTSSTATECPPTMSCPDCQDACKQTCKSSKEYKSKCEKNCKTYNCDPFC